MGINLPIYLGRNAHSSNQFVGKGWPFIYQFFQMGRAIHLFNFWGARMAIHPARFLGGDGHSSIHQIWRGWPLIYPSFWEGGGHSSTHSFWRKWPFIYQLFWDGMAIYPSFWEGLVIHLRIFVLGWGCWWSFIYPFILEGIATHLPICFWRGCHLPIKFGEDGHSSTHLFGRVVVIHPPIHSGENGHSSTNCFGMGWPSIYPSF